MQITREMFLANPCLVTEKVYLPEFGPEQYVLLRSITDRDQTEYAAAYFQTDESGNMTALPGHRGRLIELSMVDDDGNLCLQEGDWEQLQDHASSVLNKLYQVAFRLTGLEERPEDVEKKSEPTDISTDSALP